MTQTKQDTSQSQDIVQEIERRIAEWKVDRTKISEDKYKYYLHSLHIDYSICDIVIQELLTLLNVIKGRESDK